MQLADTAFVKLSYYLTEECKIHVAEESPIFIKVPGLKPIETSLEELNNYLIASALGNCYIPVPKENKDANQEQYMFKVNFMRKVLQCWVLMKLWWESNKS